MRIKVEMTLSAETAQRFKETAKRLASMNLGEDGLLAAAVLERIATDFERGVVAQELENQAADPQHGPGFRPG